MMDIIFEQGYRLPISDSLKTMRLARCPLDGGDNIFVDDRLESDCFIKIYEYLGGTFYIPADANEMNQYSKVVSIAGISVSVFEEDEIVQVDKIFCEFGYDEFTTKLMKQVMNFADFYGLKVSILDLRKGIVNGNNRTCRFVDMKYW